MSVSGRPARIPMQVVTPKQGAEDAAVCMFMDLVRHNTSTMTIEKLGFSPVYFMMGNL